MFILLSCKREPMVRDLEQLHIFLSASINAMQRNNGCFDFLNLTSTLLYGNFLRCPSLTCLPSTVPNCLNIGTFSIAHLTKASFEPATLDIWFVQRTCTRALFEYSLAHVRKSTEWFPIRLPSTTATSNVTHRRPEQSNEESAQNPIIAKETSTSTTMHHILPTESDVEGNHA
jgi:hypothetical protein